MNKDADNNLLNDTEARILQAAEHEFMAKGFAGARTTSIAEAAGVTHAMFHYYFRTKEKLFARIISEKMDMLKDLISKSVEDINQPLEVLIRNLINLHLDFIAVNPGLPRFLITEVFNNPERLSLFSDKIMGVAPGVLARLQEKIDEGEREGRYRRVDARMLMLDIVSLNIFPYLASPLVGSVLDNCMADPDEFLDRRKHDNYDTIMRKLSPDKALSPESARCNQNY